MKYSVPRISFAAEPAFEEFHAFAWESAARHVRDYSGAPCTPYMDEAFSTDHIWLWDTCFMALYCRYALQDFPGIQSLENFYQPMLDDVESSLMIHIPDNPPLTAWVEYEYYQLTGDHHRLEEIFGRRRCPQRMFELFEGFKAGTLATHSYPGSTIRAEKCELGYYWTGGRNGMDNTPRGDFGPEVFDNDPAYRRIFFLDALAQQALGAHCIWELTGDETFERRHRELCRLLNDHYWDEEDGIYYDIESAPPHRRVKVKTPASFWPLLAGACTPIQAERLAEHAADPAIFGGDIPFPSVSRDSRHFDPDGRYWRGGVWLPTAYMAIKALERNGFPSLADQLGEALLRHQLRTWREFSPHTIWEVYSPTQPCPATGKHPTTKGARADFCGWSALGPISLAIENLLGFEVDAAKNLVSWRLHQTCAHGIDDLRFGENCCSIHYDGKNTIRVKSEKPFTLKVNGREIIIPVGESSCKPNS